MSTPLNLLLMVLLWLATCAAFAFGNMEWYKLILGTADIVGVYFLWQGTSHLPARVRFLMRGLPVGLLLIGLGEFVPFVSSSKNLDTWITLGGVVFLLVAGLSAPFALEQEQMLETGLAWRLLGSSLLSTLVLSGLITVVARPDAERIVYQSIGIFLTALFLRLMFSSRQDTLAWNSLRSITRGIAVVSLAQLLITLLDPINGDAADMVRHHVWLLGISLLAFYPNPNQDSKNLPRLWQLIRNISIFNAIFLVLAVVSIPYFIAVYIHFQTQIESAFETARGFGSDQDFENAKRTMKNGILTAGLLLVPLLIISVFAITNSLGLRARRIAQMAGELSKGNLEQHFSDTSKDEIGQISSALHQMTDYQRQMAGTAQKIAVGNLAVDVQPNAESDQFGNAFAAMVRRLADLVQHLQQTASQLSSSAGEILSSTAKQTASASQQSASVAQTTSTVQEVHASAEQIAENANSVLHSAKAANQVAMVGVQAIKQAQVSIKDTQERVQDIAQNILELSEQTLAIGEIIETLSKLADQTNLLSLNAAIEAARAGEHGKGFAVVASEIRILAERSKKATSQISGILGEIQSATHTAVMTTEQGVKSAEVGTYSIESVGSTVENLKEMLEEASSHAQLIFASVQQHTIGMEQISAAMEQIQTSAASHLQGSIDTKSASQHLVDLADRLRQLAGQFER